jgi:hypothetical protein
VRHRVESGQSRRVALVGATAADVRDVMVEGPSGLLAVCPPWARPRYEPSRRRLAWPHGAVALTYSADEPDRLRGPQFEAAWVDELAAFRYPAALDNLLLGLRLGSDTRLCVTTTPRAVRLVTDLLADARTATTRATTYENRAHLAASFFERVVSQYEGTRLGRQELYAEVLEISEGAWFAGFDPARHVTEEAEYQPGSPVHLAIDAGSACCTGAVWFQVRPWSLVRSPWFAVADLGGRTVSRGTREGANDGAPERELLPRTKDQGPRTNVVCVFGDYYAEGLFSEANARAIQARGGALPGAAGRPDLVRLDPAATARSGLGPAAYGEYERVFGARVLSRWPEHRVLDGLDQLEVLLESGCLLIHPRCTHLKAAFQNYVRKRGPGGDWLDWPQDPQHPHEDLLDALRGGIRDRFPEARIEQPRLRRKHVGDLF